MSLGLDQALDAQIKGEVYQKSQGCEQLADK